MIKVVNINKVVLSRLSVMDNERKYNNSSERIIFPIKDQAKGKIERISEQELRLLFIEEFKKEYSNLFYSIETPTKKKYKFGKTYPELKANVNIDGRSALIDMCIFKKTEKVYNRILNIEFKHKNTSIRNIAKDILKLIKEKQNGLFILLLNNTDSGTFCNLKNSGVFNKLYRAFTDFRVYWIDDKIIQIVILSLKQRTLIYRMIQKSELKNLKNIFFCNDCNNNIKGIDRNGWRNVEL